MKVVTLNNLQAQRINAERNNLKLQGRAIANAHRAVNNPKANARIQKKAQRLLDAITGVQEFVAENLHGIGEMNPESRPAICQVVLTAVRKFRIPTHSLHGMLSSQLAYRMF